MPTLVAEPTRVRAAGSKPKLIDEFIGRVNTKTPGVSVAHMRSPQGWEEPGQTPEFDEFTLVLKGVLHVKHKGGEMEVAAGQAVIAHRGEWVNTLRRGRWNRIHRHLPASVFHGDCAPRRVSRQARNIPAPLLAKSARNGAPFTTFHDALLLIGTYDFALYVGVLQGFVFH